MSGGSGKERRRKRKCLREVCAFCQTVAGSFCYELRNTVVLAAALR